jgi:hypothetical protein
VQPWDSRFHRPRTIEGLSSPCLASGSVKSRLVPILVICRVEGSCLSASRDSITSYNSNDDCYDDIVPRNDVRKNSSKKSPDDETGDPSSS